MNAEVVVQTIQLVVAPAVMVSGCMLIQSSILGRGERYRHSPAIAHP